MTTIDPRHAADLYAEFDDHDELLTETEQVTMHGWTVIGSAADGQSRWHDDYWMLLRDADGATWGVAYGLGLTENQEDSLPWERGDRPLPLVRLYPREVTTVEWRRTPVGAR